MRHKRWIKWFVLCALLLRVVSSVGAQAPLGTAFTYQGRLVDGDSPANGSCDLRFILYDAAVDGSPVGSVITQEDVTVTDGLLAVELDFGSGTFAGDARYLEIAVRPGDSTDPHTVLGPRVALTATPYAFCASTAPWSGLTGIPASLDDGDDDATSTAGLGLSLVGSQFSADFGGGSASTIAPDHRHRDHNGSPQNRCLPTGSDGVLAVDGNGTHVIDHWQPADGITLAAPALPKRSPDSPKLGTGPAITTEFIFTGIAPEGDTPMELAFTPDGSQIIIAHRDSQNLIVFDADTRQVVQTIPVTGSPNSMAISSDGLYAVTANIFEDTASIVDLVAGSEVAVVPVGDQPGVVRITPDGTMAVVGNTVDSSLSIIDIGAATEVRCIADAPFTLRTQWTPENGSVSYTFSSFEIAADNKTVIHPDRFGDRIQFFDIVAGTTFSLASSGSPASVAITPDGTKAVVGHESSVRLVSVIDVASQSITKTIPTGADIRDGTIAINPSGTKAVVAVLNAARVVNLVTDTVSGDLATACCLRLRVTADGQYCFAGGYQGSLISFDTETIVANLNNVLSASIVATSPTGPRAASVANHFGEDLLVFNTDGAAGFLEEIVPSGPPPEGDKARTAAISPDGSTAVVVNILSDNATIVDVPNRLVEEIVPVGDRPAEVEITPDGSKAVVANLDSTFVSVIDLSTKSVTNVTISRRGSQVEISPDGQYAYVAVVADGDGVWRIDLNSLTVADSKLLTGNMGGVGSLFSQSSGMTLSHDGATLVTCNSFDNDISIIDTASWSQVARVPVGTFPVRAVFSSDDSTIYVTNRNSDTVSVVNNAGAGSTVVGTISVDDFPFELAVAPDGSRLFVGDRNASGDAQIDVVDLPGTVVTNTIVLADGLITGLHIDPASEKLYAAVGGSSGYFFVIDVQDGIVLDQIDTGLIPAMLAFHDANSLAITPSPFGDGLVLLWTGVADNTPPTFSDLPNVVVDETVSLPATVDLWSYASDIETPDSGLTFSIEGLPPAGAGVTLTGNRYLNANPSTDWCGYVDVTVRVTDPGGLWDEDTSRVAVTWSCKGPLLLFYTSKP
jgi:YVTN family beta-propeller protein